MISTLISSTLGLTSLALGGYADWANYGSIWLTWWLGDASGDLVVAPLILLWGVAPTQPRWPRGQVIEIGTLLLPLIGLGETVFGGGFSISAKNYPIAFICVPVVIWIAVRFTQRETATSIFILSAIAIWGTLHGFGPFAVETENQSLVILQAWAGILILTAMPLAAAMAEHRRAEAVLHEQKDAVEAANRTKDNFLAMLSHELRTPLTPVLAALDTLESDSAHSEDSKESLAMIRRNVELESHLIDDLLDLTRISKDKLQLKFEPIDAHECIADVVEICATEAAARRLRINVELRAGAHHVSADAAKFQQIIWNLLKNAIKFTGEDGDITISSANPAPQTLTIAVRDTGIGIESEIMERMFNPFEQGDRSFQRRFGLAPRQRARRFIDGTTESSNRTFRILLVDDHQDTLRGFGKIACPPRSSRRRHAEHAFRARSRDAQSIRSAHQRHRVARRHRHGTHDLSPRHLRHSRNRHQRFRHERRYSKKFAGRIRTTSRQTGQTGKTGSGHRVRHGGRTCFSLKFSFGNHEGHEDLEELQNETFDAVSKLRDIEVDKQTKRNFRKAHVRENLRLMDWKKRLVALDLDDEIAAYEQVDPITAIKQHLFVTNRQRHFHLEDNARLRQLAGQALAICRFQQTWPKIPMHFNCAPDYLSRQFVKFHLRVLRDLRGGPCVSSN